MKKNVYSIDHLENEIASLTERMQVAKSLVDCGITREGTKYWKDPAIYSGYSMGETIEIYCNGKLVQAVDNRQQYARSCTWKAKHGKIVIELNKKELKELASLYMKEATANSIELKVEMHKQQFEFLSSHVNMAKSTIKKLSNY